MLGRVEEYELVDDPDRVDVDAVWDYLSTDAYWGRWRAREDVERQVRGAWRVVSAHHPREGQVGFARAVSDGVALAYVADVYVLPPHRGRGLALRLLQLLVEDGPGARYRWLLHTRDAHGLYAKLGFGVPDTTLMERPAGR